MNSIPLGGPPSSGNMFTRISANMNTPRDGKNKSFWGCIKSVINCNETMQSIKRAARAASEIGGTYILGGGISLGVGAVMGAAAVGAVTATALGTSALMLGGVLVVGAGITFGIGIMVLALREYRSDANKSTEVDAGKKKGVPKNGVDANSPSYGKQEKKGVPKDGINASNPDYGQGRDNLAFEPDQGSGIKFKA